MYSPVIDKQSKNQCGGGDVNNLKTSNNLSMCRHERERENEIINNLLNYLTYSGSHLRGVEIYRSAIRYHST
jgi:hypothetical protein